MLYRRCGYLCPKNKGDGRDNYAWAVGAISLG